MIEKIAAYVDEYYRRTLEKRAGILENMAARVLWSTMPWDVMQNNLVALRSLIPGALELLKYGRNAVLDEAAEGMISHDHQQLPTIQDPVEFFSTASKLFQSVVWKKSYGGKSWADISRFLSYLAIAVKKAKELEGTDRYDEYKQALGEVVAYMNIIDASMHNNGMLVDKMLDLEADERGVFDLDSREKMFQDVLRVMDAKELQDPKNVISVVLPIVRTMPERFLPFKDWASEYYRQEKDTPYDDIQKQLDNVRIKKALDEAEKAVAAVRPNLYEVEYFFIAERKLADLAGLLGVNIFGKFGGTVNEIERSLEYLKQLSEKRLNSS